MNTFRIVFIVIFSVASLLHMPPKQTVSNAQHITLHISTPHECDSIEEFSESVVCRLGEFFVPFLIFVWIQTKTCKTVKIRCYAVHCNLGPKFRPQKARSVVSDEDYYLRF